jgi:hypothetical protein
MTRTRAELLDDVAEAVAALMVVGGLVNGNGEPLPFSLMMLDGEGLADIVSVGPLGLGGQIDALRRWLGNLERSQRAAAPLKD